MVDLSAEEIAMAKSAWKDLKEMPCNCHYFPPCGACEAGAGLEFNEYLELHGEEFKKK